ncbi:DNA translocase, DnaK family [Streptococcus infantarius subsp. infantarius]|nr:DNA translocase, DnaK family [Streptococcus infantarius subsp. infantarius]MCO4489604.1 DNA translocase, DnaK family [Streptococcus infantarius subsp. infantarius]MCO4491579.1 DNA translocase, DnaK family [Streptococcus infantarius subsp. infantarius]MCO4507410.1 DNA translocase, DnaK family [Streptococcus infantarius subsp. infantarius]MCO4516906.1 DNA translocase, DnaK family [Streptococcus infantarius subsp. infantarius]
MAKSKSRRKGRKTRRPTKAEIKRQKALERFILAIVTTVIFFFAMARLGIFGITVYNLVRLAVGSLAYVLMVAVLLYFLGFKWFHKQAGLIGGFVVTMIGLLLEWHAYLFSLSAFRGKEIFSTTASLIFSDLVKFKITKFVGGGMLGAVLYKPVAFLFSNVGTFLIGGLFIILGLFLMSPWEVYDLIDFFKEKSQEWAAKHEIRKQKRFVKREGKRTLAEQKRQEKAQKAEEERLAQLTVDQETGEILDGPDDNEASIFDNILVENAAVEPEILAYEHVSEGLEETASEENLKPEVTAAEEEMIDQEDDGEPLEVDFTAKANLLYKLPTIDLFAPDKPKNQSKEKNIVRRNIKVLEDTFNSFGIDVKVERAEIGPSVTKYEVKPAVGVRVNRISNLADDLALALAAKDVRIEAPIPGKSLVGIEVPNSEIATVTFRELWEQADTDPNKLLEVPLGKAVNGTARTFDLARMPHLLVAGSTGSGKSVAVNGIIASILMKARPDQVKFMMIDPKMVELSVYNDIPHLLIPVVTNPRKAARALQKVVDEMENRYELFSHFGVRNIAGYNVKVEEFNAQSEQKQIPLPLIVVIVDELADLMMVASKEVEDAIIRLGQKARAAGIHMILATQRPSVDVISGLIKANVPSRVAFAVSSGTDSRTILDENGAEKLLGRGDMLFKPIDENHPVRLQGSFISDDDVERIVGFIKNQADADYDDSFDPGEVSESDLKSGGGGASQEGDPLFEDAKALVLETQKASASMLQRRLSVGFNRATRLMDELEAAGVIGPAEGTKPRKVLMTKPTPEA